MLRGHLPPAGFWRREFSPPPGNKKGFSIPPFEFFHSFLFQRGDFLQYLDKSSLRTCAIADEAGHTYNEIPNNDGFVKSRFYPLFVIPAKAGIQLNQEVLDSRLRGSDGFFDFLRERQNWSKKRQPGRANETKIARPQDFPAGWDGMMEGERR